jgi:hypothetical protein
MRLLLIGAVALFADTASAQTGYMQNIDLPGRDIRDYWTDDVGQCSAGCRADERCVAWTWVRPGVHGAEGRCWLKSSIPQPQASVCCISAVERGTAAGPQPGPWPDPGPQPGVLNNVDLPGRDYRDFAANDMQQCRAACRGDNECMAWTWVRPGVYGPEGYCWLKESVPTQRQSECCISGIERGAAPQPGPGPGPGTGELTTIEWPRVNGIAVDHCQHLGQNCEGGGAHLFCQRQGYARAVTWMRYNPGQTFVIGSGQVCNGDHCVGYSTVTCER